MTELYSIDVRGASVEEKQQVINKFKILGISAVNFEVAPPPLEEVEELCNYFDGETDIPRNYLLWGGDYTKQPFSQHYTEFLGIDKEASEKEEPPKRVMWNDDVTLTLSAFEVIRLFISSSPQPNCGVSKSIYKYVKDMVDEFPEELEEVCESDNFISMFSILAPSDEKAKQELVDKVFNRDILEKEKEGKKKEYEDIQSQIKELQAKADKLKEEI